MTRSPEDPVPDHAPDGAESAEPAEIGSGELASLLGEAQEPNAESARRVRSTLRRAQRAVGTRDLMIFGLARTWTGLLAVVGGFFAVLSPGSSRSRSDSGGSR